MDKLLSFFISANIFNELWIPNAKKDDSGTYKVVFTTKDNCADSFDFNLVVHEKLNVSFDTSTGPFQICESQNKTITIKTNSSFDGFWKFPDGSIVPVNSNSFIRFTDLKKSNDAFRLLDSWMKNHGQSDVLNVEYIKILIEVGQFEEALKHTKSLLTNLHSSLTRHYCSQCGYNSDEIFWRCPQCHNWETIQFRWKV
jgi:hypothetical protein